MGDKRRDFGNVRQLSSGRWQARYRGFNGRWINADRTFETKEEAEAWLDSVQRAQQRSEWFKNASSELPFAEWAERWVERPRKRAKVGKNQMRTSQKKTSTTNDYRSVIKNHINPFFGEVSVGKIDVDGIYQFQDYLEESLEEKWRTNEKAQLFTRWILGFAVRKGAIAVNPYDDDEIILPDVEGRRDAVPLEIEDIDKLVKTIDELYSLPVLVAAYCGLRCGEVWGLRRGSVNLLKAEIEVAESLSTNDRKMGPTKPGKVRRVPLLKHVLEPLRDYLESTEGDPNDWLFKSPKGYQVQHNNFYRRAYRPAITDASLPTRTIFHDLRHFCARFWISIGAEPYDIMNLLGHGSINITMDIYGGLFESRREEMRRLGDLAYENYKPAPEVTQLRELVEAAES